MNFMVWFFLSKAAELNLEVTKAPQILDLEKVKSWVNGTVWCLLALNAISLVFYLSALVYPSLYKIVVSISRRVRQRKDDEMSSIQTSNIMDASESEAPISVAPPETVIANPVIAEDLRTPSNPKGENDNLSVNEIESVLDLPRIEDLAPPAPPPPPIPEPAPPPPVVEEVVPEPIAASTPASEITEVIEVKQKETLEAKQDPLPEAPVFDQKEVTMEEAPATVAAEKIDEPTAPESLPAFDALEKSLFSDVELTEIIPTNEPSIFDPSTLDQALNETPDKPSEGKKA